MIVCMRTLLLILLSGLCTGTDAQWQDFLQRHSQQLSQRTGASKRETLTSRMLARRLAGMVQGRPVDERDKHGQTALMMAAALNHSEIATGLLLHGADPTAATPKGKTAAMLCSNPELAQRIRDCAAPPPMETSLHTAAQQKSGAANMVLQLLRAGADVHARNSEGKTPLMLVAPQDKETASVLLAAGADPTHWGMEARAGAKVQSVEVVFTHKGLSAEELEAEDKEHARMLDEQRTRKVKWRRFKDPALVRRRPRNIPYPFIWDWRRRQHISTDLRDKEACAKGWLQPGRSGYLGHVYCGTVTLHYPEGVPPLSFSVQSGGRAKHFLGEADFTAPIVPEGATARIFPDCRGYTINGFFITCLGRAGIPKFCDNRSNILLHLAPVSVPGETEATTLRSSGSHGCISMKNLQQWNTVVAELRKKGTGSRDGLEASIRYDIK